MLRLESFGIDLAWILGPNLDPGGRSAKAVLLFFLCSWSCVGGKMAPGCPKSASKTDFGPILVDFWLMLYLKMMHLRILPSPINLRAEGTKL